MNATDDQPISTRHTVTWPPGSRRQKFRNCTRCLAVFAALLVPLLKCGGAEPPAPDNAALQNRIDGLGERLANTARNESQLKAATASLPGADSETLDRLAAEVSALTEERQSAERQLDAMVSDQLPASLSLAHLKSRLLEAQKGLDAIVAKITAAKNQQPGGDGSGGIPETVLVQKKPIQVVLVRNRVVPARRPYFDVTVGPGFNRNTGERLQVVIIHRAQDGIAATDAIRSGDILDKLIEEDNASKSTHFFSILLCADSIAAFQTVTKALIARGYDYTWDPFKDQDVIRPADGGGANPGDGPVRVFPADKN